jgi:hypothetical protein
MNSQSTKAVRRHGESVSKCVSCWTRSGLLYAALAILAGCTPLTSHKEEITSQSGNLSGCAGSIDPPYGLEPINDPVLLGKAVGKVDEGGLCAGQTFKVVQQLTVYRVWDSSKSNQYGNWWTFSPPVGPKDVYRRKNEICPSWNRLDRITQCRLKVGAEIVIGPGQSGQRQ